MPPKGAAGGEIQPSEHLQQLKKAKMPPSSLDVRINE
jgi:hypothetical protein